MNSQIKITKRLIGSLALPLAMYLVMMVACYSNGKMYYGTLAMWRTLIIDIAISVTCALGIGLQFKSGRFDFSGGGIMLVAAIVAGNIAKSNGNNQMLFFALCMIICVVLSILVALVYVYGRLPIAIATIAMALLYESVTCLIYKGTGINLVANMQLKIFSSYPYVLIPFGGAIAVYVIYSYLTVTGKQASLLSHNQQAAVNIGINENKNVIISYIFSGLIFGFATVIFASIGLHKASYTSLSTVGALFGNILPVFIGLMVGVFCGDAIGTIIGSVTLCIMSYGLMVVFDAEMGSAIATICTGIFILVINVVSAQGANWLRALKKLFSKKKVMI
ncbi:MAG: hypothetical protein WBI07_07805 [Mobilitalea sp.]